MTDYPGRVVGIQIHGADPWTSPWGSDRWKFYDLASVPGVAIDGTTALISGPLSYEKIAAAVNLRLSHPTDVSLDLYGKQIAPRTYRMTARLALDADAPPRIVRVHMASLLYVYPFIGAYYYHNCVRDGADVDTIELLPGEPRIVEHEFQFNDDSWKAKERIRIAAWTQEPQAAAPAGVHQAAITRWPFTDLHPCPADVNGDAAVDVRDLEEILQSWGDCPWCHTDLNGDKTVDHLDLLQVIAAWGACR